MPEPDEGKLSSPVLRGGGSREAPLLPGTKPRKVIRARLPEFFGVATSAQSGGAEMREIPHRNRYHVNP